MRQAALAPPDRIYRVVQSCYQGDLPEGDQVLLLVLGEVRLPRCRAECSEGSYYVLLREPADSVN